MIRSAKMNATTPPKLMPPFHSTAASGTLPTEQTNEMIATTGPMSGPQTSRPADGRRRRTPARRCRAPRRRSRPATSRPITRSRRIAAHSITNTCATAVKPSRREQPPRERALAAGRTCPSRRGPPSSRRAPRSACSRASRSSRSPQEQPEQHGEHTIMIGPPMNSARVNCQPMSSARITPELDHQVGRGDLERHRGGEVRALAEQRAGQRHRRVRARRRRGAEPGRDRQRARPVVAEQPHHRGPPHHGLDHRRQREPEDQRPGDLPRHRPGDRQRVPDGVDQAHLRGPPSPRPEV